MAAPKAPKEWPFVDAALVAYLESVYPARCIRPGETLEDHLRYAGAVALVQLLRDRVPASDAVEPDFAEMSDTEMEAYLLSQREE